MSLLDFGLTDGDNGSGDTDLGRASSVAALLGNLNTMRDGLTDESRRFNGFGPNEAGTFGLSVDSSGTGGENGPTFFAGAAQMLTNALDPELADIRSARENFSNAQFEAVAESLEGQGQVSNFERQGGAAAQTSLSEPSTTDDQALQEVNRMRNVLRLGSYRSETGITVDQNGFETLNGQNVVTYVGSDGEIYHQQVNQPTVVIPQWVDEELAKTLIGALPLNSHYVYNNQLRVRRGDPENQRLEDRTGN